MVVFGKVGEMGKKDDSQGSHSPDVGVRLRRGELLLTNLLLFRHRLVIGIIVLGVAIAGVCGYCSMNSADTPQDSTQQDGKKPSKTGDTSSARGKGASTPQDQEDGTDDLTPDDPRNRLGTSSGIKPQKLIDKILKGRVDVRSITSGDLESGDPYDAVDEETLPYVAYPADKSGDYHVDTIRVAEGRFSFDMPAGFWLISDASSDNPAIKTFIRNDELGVTIGIGHGESDETVDEMVEHWTEEGSEYVHSGTRYSYESKGGYSSGLVWKFVCDEVSGVRHLVTKLPDDSLIYIDVLTEPWPEYTRDGSPHLPRWIHEIVNSVQLLGAPEEAGTN